MVIFLNDFVVPVTKIFNIQMLLLITFFEIQFIFIIFLLSIILPKFQYKALSLDKQYKDVIFKLNSYLVIITFLILFLILIIFILKAEFIFILKHL